MKRFFRKLWINIQAIFKDVGGFLWEMKWVLLGMIVVILFISWSLISCVYILFHPELIGEYFGRIIRGFNSVK